MFLLSNSPFINLLPLVEKAFALGQKHFRPMSKAFSTKGERLKSGSNSCNSYLSFKYIVVETNQSDMVNLNQDEIMVKAKS